MCGQRLIRLFVTDISKNAEQFTLMFSALHFCILVENSVVVLSSVLSKIQPQFFHSGVTRWMVSPGTVTPPRDATANEQTPCKHNIPGESSNKFVVRPCNKRRRIRQTFKSTTNCYRKHRINKTNSHSRDHSSIFCCQKY